MPFTFLCPVCKSSHQAETAAVGTRIHCSCGQRLQVPEPPVVTLAPIKLMPPAKTVLGVVEDVPVVELVSEPPISLRKGRRHHDDREEQREGPRREKQESYGWVVALVLGLTVPVVLVFSFCMLGSLAPTPKNARCPLCGQEFNIPVHHGIGQLTNEYSCPNCQNRLPANMLYKQPAFR